MTSPKIAPNRIGTFLSTLTFATCQRVSGSNSTTTRYGFSLRNLFVAASRHFACSKARSALAQGLSSDGSATRYPFLMSQDKREPTERTPKGLEVPIPKRSEFFENLKKIAKPRPKRDSAPDRPEK